MYYELRVDNGINSFEPVVCGEVLYESYADGRCSKLSFDILSDALNAPLNTTELAVKEGDVVSLKIGGFGAFCGVVFQRKKGSSDGTMSVVAYDQLRYLKNKDTYVYSGKRASDVVRMIALDYKLRQGEIKQTQYVIPHRIEDNVTLMDIIGNALDLELQHSGRRFTLIDSFGHLSLQDDAGMFSGVVLDRDTVGDVCYFSSIDNRSNRVKVSRYDAKSGRREVFVAKDEHSENRLGILQHYLRIADKNETLSSRARALLSLYNKDERSITVSGALGCAAVRGGSLVEFSLEEFMGRARAARVVHRLSGSGHLMDIDGQLTDN